MSRDDISKTPANSILAKVFLAPGKVIQWLIYMFPVFFGGKQYAHIRMLTRWARSPIMCKFFASLFWLGAILIGVFFMYSFFSV